MDESLTALQDALRGSYDIDRLIGRGGMADVYLATDQKHKRQVALKVLRGRQGFTVSIERFTREIQTAARLQHPNILPVYDSGEAGGALFYVMPFVEDLSLRHKLEREGPLTWSGVRPIVLEVADALRFAHEHGVVHRDIKPENILFLGGHAVVADFGIALAVTEAAGARLTLEGQGVGTPEYMSPEQAFGEHEVDARTDVYSLGCMIYEMLTGSPPWSGTPAFAMMLRKSRETPPELRTRKQVDVPQFVSEVVNRALSPSPDDRYPSIAAMLEDLTNENLAIEANARDHAGNASQSASSVAVLPFANLSGDPRDEILSDGLSEDLIFALGKVSGLRVVARTSSFRFKNQSDDVRSIGRELKVGAILEGSVRRSGDRLRIMARLVDAATGFERWSERFDREFMDVFHIQDEISRAIVRSLEGTMRPTADLVVPPPTHDMAAYELYLEARFSWNQRTSAALRRSVHLLQEVVERDATFASAHAALAETSVTLAVYGDARPGEVMAQARESAQRALAIDAHSSVAHTALGCVRSLFDWEWADAESHFRVATQARHATATAFQWYAMNLLVPLQRFDEAREQLQRAQSIDPLSPVVTSSIGVTHHAEGNQEAAIREFRSALARDPSFGMAHYFLGRALASNDELEPALLALTRAASLLEESVEVLTARAVVLAQLGRRSDALQLLGELDAQAGNRYVSRVLRAEILAALDRPSDALVMLEAATLDRATDLAWIETRPAFRGIRGKSRYQRVLRAIGLVS